MYLYRSILLTILALIMPYVAAYVFFEVEWAEWIKEGSKLVLVVITIGLIGLSFTSWVNYFDYRRWN